MKITEKGMDNLIREELQKLTEEGSVYPKYHELLESLGTKVLLENLVQRIDKETINKALKEIAGNTGVKLLGETRGKKVKNL